MKSCCSSTGHKNTNEHKVSVRGHRFIGSRLLVPILVGIIVVCVLYLYSHYSPVGSRTIQSLNIVTEANAADLTYSQDQFSDGKAHHYKHKTSDGVNIRYFIIKSSDGVVRAAFDACDVCFAEGKGYTQKGDFMVCNNCGRKFQSARINEVSGGCNPAPLNRTVKDGKVMLRTEDIEKGKKYFDLRGGPR
jgi:uncharacterized membrane protein